MKLYRSPDLPGRWIGEDQDGALVHWPIERGGWNRRTPYTGGKRQLEEVAPALARGTGWPGGGRGRRPLRGAPCKPVTIRATDDERAAWDRAAERRDRTLSDWCRDTLNAAAAAEAAGAAAPAAGAPRQRPKSKP
jgi:hypothetical protein